MTAGSLACIRPLFKIMMQRIGWNSDAYFHPSMPLNGEGGGGGANGKPATIGGSRRTRRTDDFNMASLFSRSDDVDGDGGSGDAHSVGSASTTKLVDAGGIMKTSAFTVKIEEREPAPPVRAKPEDGGPSDGREDLGRVRSG